MPAGIYKMCRQTGTGREFPFTEQLMARGDMEEFEKMIGDPSPAVAIAISAEEAEVKPSVYPISKKKNPVVAKPGDLDFK